MCVCVCVYAAGIFWRAGSVLYSSLAFVSAGHLQPIRNRGSDSLDVVVR